MKVSKTDITGTEEVLGAIITVYEADANGNIIGEAIASWISSKVAHDFGSVLEAGKSYVLVETSAPEGYAYSENILFSIAKDGTVTSEALKDGVILVKDEAIHFNVNKVELADNAKEVSGAELVVYKVGDDGGLIEVDKWISEAGKIHDFGSKLFAETNYILRETAAPEGYAFAADIVFRVEKDGTITTTAKSTKDEHGNVIYLLEDDITRVHILKTDENNKELAGAHFILKDAEGKIVADWISTEKAYVLEGKLNAGAEYTLVEVSAPEGYEVAKEIPFTVNRDGQLLTIVVEDKTADGNASITVQKYVKINGKYTAIDYTFYTALFADEACTERVSSVKALNVAGSYTTSVTFDNLQYGTYYVAETDKNGNAISQGEFIESIEIIDGKAELTPNKATAKSTIINHITGLEPGYYMDGDITVDKKVLINGKAGKVNDTFYFALFTDAEMTMLSDAGIKALRLDNAAEGTVIFEDLPYGEYYLAETDMNGNPVDSSFEYGVTISSYCKIDGENSSISKTVINEKEEKEEESETETTKEAKSVKTSDDTPIMEYMMLLGASAIVLLGLYGKKRRKRNNA